MFENETGIGRVSSGIANRLAEFLVYLHDKWDMEPVKPTHFWDSEVWIAQGQTYGEVLIPCTFYTLSHEIDTRPDGERYPWGEGPPWTNPPKKPAPPPMQIKETRYRSCPLISVRLSEPADKNLTIPVSFGFRRAELYAVMYGMPVLWVVLTGALAYSSISSGVVPLMLVVPVIGWMVAWYLRAATKTHKWWKKVRSEVRKASPEAV